MLRCKIYDLDNEDESPIGGDDNFFYFETLPSKDDVLYLLIKHDEKELQKDEYGRLICKVVKAIQWSASASCESEAFNEGELEVLIIDENTEDIFYTD
jgi:hypothetical protein